MSDEGLTQEEIRKVLDAMPGEASTVGIGEIIFNIIDGFDLTDEEFVHVLMLVTGARSGRIKAKEFGPNGERDGDEVHQQD